MLYKNDKRILQYMLRQIPGSPSKCAPTFSINAISNGTGIPAAIVRVYCEHLANQGFLQTKFVKFPHSSAVQIEGYEITAAGISYKEELRRKCLLFVVDHMIEFASMVISLVALIASLF